MLMGPQRGVMSYPSTRAVSGLRGRGVQDRKSGGIGSENVGSSGAAYIELRRDSDEAEAVDMQCREAEG